MTLINPQAALVAAKAEKARRSLAEFVRQAWPLVDPGMPLRWGWHVDAICAHLEEVSRGGIRRLLINIPPGHAKSLLVAVFWPAWEWTWKPTTQSIFSSYAQELAERDSVRCRDLILQPWYQERFVTRQWEVGSQEFYAPDGAPWEFNPAQNRVNSFKNTVAGARQCLSVGSKATGFRGNKVVCDDPLNATDAMSDIARESAWYWWSIVMSTRVNDPATDSFLMICQRLHEDDPSGRILAGKSYEHLCLPTEFEGDRRCVTYIKRPDAPKEQFFEDPRSEEGELLFPALFTPEVVEQTKAPITGLGTDGFAGQHQQRPSAAEGGMFKKTYWRFWAPDGTRPVGDAPRPKGCVSTTNHPPKALPKLHQIIGSLDAAFKDGKKNDYVVFTVWGIHFAERYLLEIVRMKLDYGATKARLAGCLDKRCRGCAKCALALTKRHPKARRWLVEDKANGSAIVNELRIHVPGIIEVNPEGGKVTRAEVTASYAEAGQIYLAEGDPQNEVFVEEHAMFPRGKHDDIVDSTSQLMVYTSCNVDVARLAALANAD